MSRMSHMRVRARRSPVMVHWVVSWMHIHRRCTLRPLIKAWLREVIWVVVLRWNNRDWPGWRLIAFTDADFPGRSRKWVL